MDTLTKRHIEYDRSEFTDDELIDIYRSILKPRLIEDKMLILLRQGKISKWFSGWGCWNNLSDGRRGVYFTNAS